MNTIKVKTPAKINLTLDILAKREDGFHSLKSIMQTVDLYDYLTISALKADKTQITLSGTSTEIPYNSSNLAHKATELFLDKANLSANVNIYIEKNIPIAAGLAGGSSNAAGVLFGLNKIFDEILSIEHIDELASQLGSDVNFCLHGGTQIATSRGEILQKINTPKFNVVLVNPKGVYISAKEAYVNYSNLENKPNNNYSDLMIEFIEKNDVDMIAKNINNNLENGILPNYPVIIELKELLIKSGCDNSLMSGSGSTVFGIYKDELNEIKGENLSVFYCKTVENGVGIS